MGAFRRMIRGIPGVLYLHQSLQNFREARRLKRANAEEVFSDIYRKNAWRGKDSVSGPGSDLDETGAIVRELPGLFRDLGVTSVLDVPCGDFHWMSRVPLDGIDYTGADIVRELIERNRSAFARANVRFECLNLLTDKLPAADLILCRDCLVHFSFRDARAALRNLSSGGSKLLLTTTFTSRPENADILTGQWRPINLEKPPFSLPRPLRLIDECCTEKSGLYRDKSLALWRLADIASCLKSDMERVTSAGVC